MHDLQRCPYNQLCGRYRRFHSFSSIFIKTFASYFYREPDFENIQFVETRTFSSNKILKNTVVYLAYIDIIYSNAHQPKKFFNVLRDPFILSVSEHLFILSVSRHPFILSVSRHPII